MKRLRISRPARFAIVGCDFPISGAAVSTLALLLHARNSAEHGALSAPEGISKSIARSRVRLLQSRGRNPADPSSVVRPPSNEDFGSILIRAAVTGQLGGEIVQEWMPEGLVTRVSILRAQVTR